MPKTVDFCDGPKCGWQRPVTEVVVEGKRKRLCDGCLKLVTDAKRTLGDVVDGLLEPQTPATQAAALRRSRAWDFFVGFIFGMIVAGALVALFG